MNMNNKFFSMIFLSLSLIAHDSTENITVAQQESQIFPVQAHACSCGPCEHWFHKTCVKNYNKQFPGIDLPENYDTEGLSSNLLEAIEMLAQNIIFVAQDGTKITPELNAKGKLILKLSRNKDYIACKNILKQVDMQTTLSAQDLYQQWLHSLRAMKLT